MTMRESIIEVMKEDIWTPGSLSLVGMLFAIESKNGKVDFNELMQEVKRMCNDGIIVKDGSLFDLVQKHSPDSK